MEKRNTIQKQLVLDAVCRLANHPTAEEVYHEVSKTHPTVSKATVYRNLSSLSEDGLLRHIQMPGGADRFDHTLADHNHIVCTECGCFSDAMVPENEKLDAQAEKVTGYAQVSHDIVFRGLCPKCSGASNQ